MKDKDPALAYLQSLPSVFRQLHTLQTETSDALAALRAAIIESDTDRALAMTTAVDELLTLLLARNGSDIESYYWLYMQMKMQRLEYLQALAENRPFEGDKDDLREVMRRSDLVVSAAIADIDPDIRP